MEQTQLLLFPETLCLYSHLTRNAIIMGKLSNLKVAFSTGRVRTPKASMLIADWLERRYIRLCS